MDAELESLDARVTQLALLCQRLRKDNVELRQELAAAQAANRHLSDKIDAARVRLEALLERIPEDVE